MPIPSKRRRKVNTGPTNITLVGFDMSQSNSMEVTEAFENGIYPQHKTNTSVNYWDDGANNFVQYDFDSENHKTGPFAYTISDGYSGALAKVNLFQQMLQIDNLYVFNNSFDGGGTVNEAQTGEDMGYSIAGVEGSYRSASLAQFDNMIAWATANNIIFDIIWVDRWQGENEAFNETTNPGLIASWANSSTLGKTAFLSKFSGHNFMGNFTVNQLHHWINATDANRDSMRTAQLNWANSDTDVIYIDDNDVYPDNALINQHIPPHAMDLYARDWLNYLPAEFLRGKPSSFHGEKSPGGGIRLDWTVTDPLATQELYVNTLYPFGDDGMFLPSNTLISSPAPNVNTFDDDSATATATWNYKAWYTLKTTTADGSAYEHIWAVKSEDPAPDLVNLVAQTNNFSPTLYYNQNKAIADGWANRSFKSKIITNAGDFEFTIASPTSFCMIGWREGAKTSNNLFTDMTEGYYLHPQNATQNVRAYDNGSLSGVNIPIPGNYPGGTFFCLRFDHANSEKVLLMSDGKREVWTEVDRRAVSIPESGGTFDVDVSINVHLFHTREGIMHFNLITDQ